MLKQTSWLCTAAALIATTGAPAELAKSEKDTTERLVCKNQIKSGTRLRTRLCMKKSSWELGAERAKKEMEELTGPQSSKSSGQ